MVSFATFIRNAPSGALRDYFQREDIALSNTVNWSARGRKFAQPLLDAIERLDEPQRARVENDVERISGLSDEAGEAALYSIVSRPEALDSLESSCARSLHVFLKDPDAFRRAEEIRYTDAHRRGRMWDGYMAKAGLALSRDREAIETFKREVRKRFKAENVHVDVFDRTRAGGDGQIYRLVQVTVYRDGRHNDVLEFVRGELTRRPMRPVIEAALTYETETGVIEVVANVRENRRDFVDLFSGALLNHQSSKNPIPLRKYELSRLTRPYDFPTDPEDGIEAVRVSLLRLMPTHSAAERVTLECERQAPNTIWQMAADNLGLANPLHSGWIVTRAKLLVSFRQTSDWGRGKVLPLTITMPHGCDLKERTDRERVVGEKYLRCWGILTDA